MSRKEPHDDPLGPVSGPEPDPMPGADADDQLLAPFLAAARRGDGGRGTVSRALSERLMADALAVMPAPAVGLRQAPRRGRLRLLFEALGGGMGLAAASVAGAFGFWLGLAEPEPAALMLDPLRAGAGQISPQLASWRSDPLDAFDEGALLSLMGDF